MTSEEKRLFNAVTNELHEQFNKDMRYLKSIAFNREEAVDSATKLKIDELLAKYSQKANDTP